jgi:hypothetical protein
VTSIPSVDPPQPEEPQATIAVVPELRPRPSMTETLLDNLSAWTVVASAIALLFLVWVTLEILGRYVGDLPKVGS